MTLRFKLGRKPRSFSPHVMHLSAVFGAMPVPTPPPTVDWTKGITSFGMMLNDRLGDCTCAALYHARQIWTANTGAEDTQPDSSVLSLYESACGYNPDDSSTDQGGNEQSILSGLLKTGMPLANGATDKILAYFEVDSRNIEDVKTVINQCGVAYIGFNVPEGIDENPGALWDNVDPNSNIEGGHAVILTGYDDVGPDVVSWGARYKMTWAFFQQWTDEAYAIVDPTWVKDGKTPLGLTPEQLTAMMHAV